MPFPHSHDPLAPLNPIALRASRSQDADLFDLQYGWSTQTHERIHISPFKTHTLALNHARPFFPFFFFFFTRGKIYLQTSPVERMTENKRKTKENKIGKLYGHLRLHIERIYLQDVYLVI